MLSTVLLRYSVGASCQSRAHAFPPVLPAKWLYISYVTNQFLNKEMLSDFVGRVIIHEFTGRVGDGEREQ